MMPNTVFQGIKVKNRTINLLHPLWGRSPVSPYMITPVNDLIRVFSLPHACLAGGLIEILPNKRPGFRRLAEICARKWHRNIEAFLYSLEMVGINSSVLEEKAESVRGLLIGWVFEGLNHNDIARRSPEYLWGINTDIALTIALLSKCVEGLLIGFRTPDYSWDTLFAHPVAFDDASLTATPVDDKPWNRFELFRKEKKK